MPKLNVQTVLQNIAQDKLSTCYYLVGKEKFFQDQILSALTQKVFPERAAKDLNLNILYGSENSLSELLSACLSYPMLAERKLVIVRDFDRMKMADADAFQKYLDNPQKSTCLVLSAGEKGRAKIYDHISNTGTMVDCMPVPEYKLSGWIANHCRSLGQSIEPQASQLLIGLIGSSLLSLDQELKKIIDYKNDDRPISVDHLEQTTGISKEANVFGLQRALARRQLEASLNIAKSLLESGTDLSMINAVLFAFFNRLLQVYSLQTKQNDPKQIATKMHLRDFQLKEIFSALSVFKGTQIMQIINYLHEVDIAAKTSSGSADSLLQMLCFKICRIQ